jgi:thiamine kinase-like enzyme
MRAPELHALVERVPGWVGRASVIGLLDGGITNRNVLVEVGDDRFVLRLAGKDTELLEIRRSDEVVAARRAASLGIGPEVVAFLEPEGYLVTRFVVGVTMTDVDLRVDDAVTAVGRMLREVHDGPPLAGSFDAFRVPELHLAAARSRGVAVPRAYSRCAEVAARIEAAFGASPEPSVPCHNDLLPANFLRSADRQWWLLDWEYAGNNDRFFDLGNLAVNNAFGPDDERALLEAYLGDPPAPRHVARLRLMRLMSDLREAMWGVVQQGISELDFDYVSYAEEHFDRFAAAAAGVELDRWLDAAASPAAPG